MFREALEAGEGILRLFPTWVPRALQIAGGRLRLDPVDLYALGADRGGIDERWLASTTRAQNGPCTPPDEGLSYIWHNGRRMLLRDVVEQLAESWQVLCKLFDNAEPIALHMHQNDAQASLVGQRGKPEAYYFPKQYNAIPHKFPYTFFGLKEKTTKGQVRDCLARWNRSDNGILNLSRKYEMDVGTGWLIDCGILHAPGTLVTYEPQRNSDVGAFFQSMVGGRPMPPEMLFKDVPPEYAGDIDYAVDLLDWEANLDPAFCEKRRRVPIAASECEKWVVSGSPFFSAKELELGPGEGAMIRDAAAYGALVIEGQGRFGVFEAEAPVLIRYGEMTRDEFFVTTRAAREGIRVVNTGPGPLVILKHFGPGLGEA